MSFASIAKDYIGELSSYQKQAKDTNQFTPELSYRPATDLFIRKLCGLIKPSAKIVFEPKKQALAGRPDWRIYDDITFGIYGYIEGKGLDFEKFLQLDLHEEQVRRYLDLGSKVILTDGIDFDFFSPGHAECKRISLVPKPFRPSSKTNPQINLDLEVAFREFLEEQTLRVTSELELVKESALRARALSSELTTFVDMPLFSGGSEEEDATIEALHKLKGVLEKHHDKTLNTSKAFSDFVSQVLIFGLLYAHRMVSEENDTPRQRDDKIKSFWTKAVYSKLAEKLRPFAALVKLLGSELKSLGPLGTWYTDCRLMLAHARLDTTKLQTPDFHKLYERFFEVFDKHSKFDYGAFYTDRDLANYAISLAENALRDQFQDRSLYESDNKLIDPCCGTGTFVELLLLNSIRAKQTPRIIGFEILPAPYALAQHRLALVGTQKQLAKVDVILTNTLSDTLEKASSSGEKNSAATEIIINEQNRARTLSKPPLMLVVGNPPSSDSPRKGVATHFTIIDKLVNDFRPPAGSRHSRQNIQKQTQNEFIYFLRWACNKLCKHAGPGVLSFIVPNSFLQNPSYAPSRQWLLEHFNSLWILDVDEDRRRGGHTESIFGVLQGHCLLVAVKGNSKTSSDTCEVKFYSIAELPKEDKRKFLTSGPNSTQKSFNTIKPKASKWEFVIPGKWNRDLYASYWALCPENNEPSPDESYVFARHCSGLKLAPSNLLIHSKRPRLERRSKEIANPDSTYDKIKADWFGGQKKPPAASKVTDEVKEAMAVALKSPASIHLYSYRPFLQMYGLISEDLLSVLSKTKGGGTRARPEVLAAFNNPTTVGLAISPSPREISKRLTRFASFCSGIPDNDLTSRGNAHIFCNYFPAYKGTSKDWNPTVVSNVNERLTAFFASSLKKGITPETAILHYCYAVLSSDWYRDQFEDALFSVKSWPRMPFPKDPSLLLALAEIGEELAQCENFSVDGSNFSDDPRVKAWKELKLSSFSVDEKKEIIILNGQDGDAESLADIPKEILTFSISGYQVIPEWLKFHSFVYTRSTFRSLDLTELLSLVARIKKHLELSKKAAKLISTFAEKSDLLLQP